MKHSILCVDDEVDNVDSLERLLRRKYTVLKATSGHDALKILDQNRVALIISDQRMPVMTGVEFLRKAQLKQPHATRILLTGYADIEVVIEAVNAGGIYRYLNKPWDPTDLMQTVDSAVERFAMGQELIEKNRSLEKALTELQTLDHAKTQFMMLINHELKTPLTTILSFSQLMRESRLDEETTLYSDRIHKSALKLKALVDDSLDLIRLETGLTVKHIETVDLQACVRAVLAQPQIESLAVKRKIEIVQTVDGKAVLQNDRALVEKLIEHVVENAVQFAPEDSRVVIEIEAGGARSGVGAGAADSAAGASLPRFVVRNRAPQLTDDKMAILMKPFTLNEEAWNHSKGTGLGLALSQAIAKHLGLSFVFQLHDGELTAGFAVVE